MLNIRTSWKSQYKLVNEKKFWNHSSITVKIYEKLALFVKGVSVASNDSSKFFQKQKLFCVPLKKIIPYRFGNAHGWVNDDSILI